MESAEHIWIGDQLTLEFGLKTANAKDHPFALGYGKNLTYGQVIALAGDLYGVVGGQISSADDPPAAFRKAWNTLAEGDNHELQEILAIMAVEVAAFDQAIVTKSDPSRVYDALGDSLSHRWNGATGGSSTFWIPTGRYLLLAAENWDHFGATAKRAYQVGHQLAMEEAVKARGAGRDQKLLEVLLGRAYAMNAFADHFLTDLFSAGHLRVPRMQMYAIAANAPAGLRDAAKAMCGVCVRSMHNEDSANGLQVRNAEGAHWRAYGDKKLLDAGSEDNRAMVVRAAQASANDVTAAYMSGEFAFSALQLIPDLDELAKPGTTEDHLNDSPMFVWRNRRVERRSDLGNRSDFSWTANWDLLMTYLSLPDVGQAVTRYGHGKCITKGDGKVVGWLSSDAKGNAKLARDEKDAHGVTWDFSGSDLFLQKDTSGGERWLGLGWRSYASWGVKGGWNNPVVYNADGTIALKSDPTRLLFLDNDDWLSWTQPGVADPNILIVSVIVPEVAPTN